jgi:hypothetical protein
MMQTITRRLVLTGVFVSIAAPAIIRHASVLMPVRDRTTPSLAEVVAWRRDFFASIHAGFDFSAERLNEFTRMRAAEDRYRAMGLLPPVEHLGDYCGSGHDIMGSLSGEGANEIFGRLGQKTPRSEEANKHLIASTSKG